MISQMYLDMKYLLIIIISNVCRNLYYNEWSFSFNKIFIMWKLTGVG